MKNKQEVMHTLTNKFRLIFFLKRDLHVERDLICVYMLKKLNGIQKQPACEREGKKKKKKNERQRATERKRNRKRDK